MKKKVGIIKRNIAIFLIIAMSINSFGSIVSDNDGSAFITKSEFDALKSSFQSQIDSYNNSIDSKIDGAIASYLSGITVAKVKELDPIINKLNAIEPVRFTKTKTFQVTSIGDLYSFGGRIDAGGATAETLRAVSGKLAAVYQETFWHFWFNFFENGTDYKIGGDNSTISTGSTPDFVMNLEQNKDMNWYIGSKNYYKRHPMLYIVGGEMTNFGQRDNTYSTGADIGGGGINYYTTQVWHPYVNTSLNIDNSEQEFGNIFFPGSITLSMGYGAVSYDASGEPKTSGTAYSFKPSITAGAITTWDTNYGGASGTEDTTMYHLVGNKLVAQNCIGFTNNEINKPDVNGNSKELVVNFHGQRARRKWNDISADFDPKTMSITSNENDPKWEDYDNLKKGYQDLKVRLYRHKYHSVSSTNLVLNDYTNAAGFDIKYYNGVPLCQTDAEGIVTVDLTITGNNLTAAGTIGTFKIKEGEFNNVELSTETAVTLEPDSDNFTIDKNHLNKKIKFKVQKNKTYWIKILPANEGTFLGANVSSIVNIAE